MRSLPVEGQEVVRHFTARADHYDLSSRWCTDGDLVERFLGWINPRPHERVLDVACGTGLWSRVFQGRAAMVVGTDITPAMYRRARGRLTHVVHTPSERLPFQDGVFDLATVRQGIQFTDAPVSVSEMARVTRPGGRVVLVQLCAYGQADRDEFFEILRLRNPARRNFFVRDDLRRLLEDAGCDDVVVHDYVSDEDVDRWADNHAIAIERRTAIRALYDGASPSYRDVHGVSLDASGHYHDRMLFGVAVGVRRQAHGR